MPQKRFELIAYNPKHCLLGRLRRSEGVYNSYFRAWLARWWIKFSSEPMWLDTFPNLIIIEKWD